MRRGILERRELGTGGLLPGVRLGKGGVDRGARPGLRHALGRALGRHAPAEGLLAPPLVVEAVGGRLAGRGGGGPQVAVLHHAAVGVGDRRGLFGEPEVPAPEDGPLRVGQHHQRIARHKGLDREVDSPASRIEPHLAERRLDARRGPEPVGTHVVGERDGGPVARAVAAHRGVEHVAARRRNDVAVGAPRSTELLGRGTRVGLRFRVGHGRFDHAHRNRGLAAQPLRSGHRHRKARLHLLLGGLRLQHARHGCGLGLPLLDGELPLGGILARGRRRELQPRELRAADREGDAALLTRRKFDLGGVGKGHLQLTYGRLDASLLSVVAAAQKQQTRHHETRFLHTYQF